MEPSPTVEAPTQAPTETPPAVSNEAPTTSSEPAAPTPTPTVAALTCKNQATFVDDVTVPDGTSFRQEETFTKTWRVRNTGECTWDASYSLVFAGGEMMNAQFSSPLPAAAPGEDIDISLVMTAPARGGSYVSNWEFQDPAGERFGVGFTGKGPLWAQVAVTFFIPPTQPASGGGETAPDLTPVSIACPAVRDTSIENAILGLINDARQQNGLGPLSLDPRLSAAALAHSTDMACSGNVSHTGSDGSTWYERVAAQGFDNYNSSRENIYVGNPAFGGDAKGAFIWWWNSQVHKDNMLFEAVSVIGIAYVFNPQSEYGGYYTTVFARP
jgi:uncharacterized protein YkwD